MSLYYEHDELRADRDRLQREVTHLHREVESLQYQIDEQEATYETQYNYDVEQAQIECDEWYKRYQALAERLADVDRGIFTLDEIRAGL